jgi:hypothetical protein
LILADIRVPGLNEGGSPAAGNRPRNPRANAIRIKGIETRNQKETTWQYSF